MAGPYRVLSDRDFASAQAFQNALFGDERGAYGVLEEEQRVIMDQEIQYIEADPNLQVPEEFKGQVGTRRYASVPRGRLRALVQDMPFATVARFWEAGEAGEGVEDIRPVAEKIMRMLRTVAPPSRSTAPLPPPKSHPYRYRQSFRFVIGSTAYQTIPPEGTYTIIGITNVAPHAATMENPGWPQPFRKMWMEVERMSRAENFDARFSYLAGSSLPQKREAYWESRGYALGQRTPFGVILGKQDYGHRRPIRYAVPVIWVGPLNSMGGKTGRMKARHRRNRRKRVW